MFVESKYKCDHCENNCQGGCEECLNAIHFSHDDRPYNCSNIVYFYTCKYTYKYSSEVDILISKLKSLKSFKAFNVLSIGCGPCTELIGLLRCSERSGFNKPITYAAFEMNEIWKPIHGFFIDQFKNLSNNNIRFSYSDACQAIPRLNLRNVEWKPNILILQYVLSDMDKASMQIKPFIDDLFSKVISYMPLYSYIIINDINHWKARQWFDYLKNKFNKKYIAWNYRGYFENNNRKAYEYGTMHTSNRLTCPVDNVIDRKYHPWKFCSSAHLVLKKRGIR